LLRGINFTLEPGHGLGVIGPTGSGKSTLARALVGVWPVYAGTVRLDGFTIDQWPAEQIGQAIGYLPQDVELFDGTVRDNIARFEPEPDHDKVLAAAQAAHVHELIGQFPRGYDTPLGEGGQRLSAGQRQRIGLARALYGQPKLIVLDEPNANLDSAGETALVRALLDARRRGATVVVVAHHASALNAVDLVLYLNEGQQRELGPKRQVLEKLLRTTRSAAPTPVHPSVRPQSAQAGTAIAKPAGNPSDESSGAN
jgi:ABC-type protease/lipase transport system fused ATPase/permease subunit